MKFSKNKKVVTQSKVEEFTLTPSNLNQDLNNPQVLHPLSQTSNNNKENQSLKNQPNPSSKERAFSKTKSNLWKNNWDRHLWFNLLLPSRFLTSLKPIWLLHSIRMPIPMLKFPSQQKLIWHQAWIQTLIAMLKCLSQPRLTWQVVWTPMLIATPNNPNQPKQT